MGHAEYLVLWKKADLEPLMSRRDYRDNHDAIGLQ